MKNLNDLAKEICKLEGGKVNLTIAQVKEVIRCICELQLSSGITTDEGDCIIEPGSPLDIMVRSFIRKANTKKKTKGRKK